MPLVICIVHAKSITYTYWCHLYLHIQRIFTQIPEQIRTVCLDSEFQKNYYIVCVNFVPEKQKEQKPKDKNLKEFKLVFDSLDETVFFLTIPVKWNDCKMTENIFLLIFFSVFIFSAFHIFIVSSQNIYFDR